MKTMITAVAFVAVVLSSNVHAEANTQDAALDLYFGVNVQQDVEQAEKPDSRVEAPEAN